MNMFLFGCAIGTIVATIPWWLHVRGLNGVISDLKDVGNVAQQAKNAVK